MANRIRGSKGTTEAPSTGLGAKEVPTQAEAKAPVDPRNPRRETEDDR